MHDSTDLARYSLYYVAPSYLFQTCLDPKEKADPLLRRQLEPCSTLYGWSLEPGNGAPAILSLVTA